MVTVTFPDRATEKRALAFLLVRFSGRVLRSGEHLVPVAVLLDIDEYRELLEKAEEVESLKTLEEMRKAPIEFRRLEDFLAEHSLAV
jgi:hypothetical protein